MECDDIVELRSEAARGDAAVDLRELACAWADDLAAGREPASHGVVRRLIAGGAAGVLVPSFANGARDDDQNLVLWRWGPDPPYRAAVFDPSGRLPRNALSWR